MFGLIGKTKKTPSPITDFFNGFNRSSSDSYTGGPTVVADNSGVLVQPPLNRMGIEGGRLSYDLTEGATLGPELVGTQSATAYGTNVVTTEADGFAKCVYGSDANGVYLRAVGQALVSGRRYLFVWAAKVNAGTSVATRLYDGTSYTYLSDPITSTSEVQFSQQVTANIGVQPLVNISSFGAGETAYLKLLSIKEVSPIWLPTATPAYYVKTCKGSVAMYGDAFRGFLNEPARTNRVLCRKHNPTDLSSVAKSGDASSVLSVAQSVAALGTAGLSGICTNGNIYRLDNSAGVAVAHAEMSGSTNTNPHSFSVYSRKVSGSGFSRMSLSGAADSEVAITGSGFTRITRNNYTPAGAYTLRVTAGIGDIVEFILPQLEEGAFCTSVIPGDTLATVTRASTVYSRSTAGVLRANDWGVWLRVVPTATGQASFLDLFSTYVDANNQTRVYTTPTTVVFYKRIAGINYTAFVNYTYAAGVPFEVQAIQSSAYGMVIRVKQDGGAWSAFTLKNDADGIKPVPVAATFSIGNRQGADHFAAYFPFTAPIMHPDPKAELERLAARYP